MEHPSTLIEKGKLYDMLKKSHNELIEVLELIRTDIEWTKDSPTLKYLKRKLAKAKKL